MTREFVEPDLVAVPVDAESIEAHQFLRDAWQRERTRAEAQSGRAFALAVVNDSTPGAAVALAILRKQGQRVSLLPPQFVDAPQSPERRVAVVAAAARWALSMGGMGLRTRTVLAYPADDVDDNEVFMAGLHAGGFKEVACAHVWEIEQPQTFSTVESMPEELDVRDYFELATSEQLAVSRLIGDVRQQTADRVDQTSSKDGEGVIQELLEGWLPNDKKFGYTLWTAADEVIGYLFASIDEEGEGWVLDGGLDPGSRHQGLAVRGLGIAIGMIRERGANTLRSLIDDANEPSVALHKRLGFRRIEERYWTFSAAVSD